LPEVILDVIGSLVVCLAYYAGAHPSGHEEAAFPGLAAFLAAWPALGRFVKTIRALFSGRSTLRQGSDPTEQRDASLGQTPIFPLLKDIRALLTGKKLIGITIQKMRGRKITNIEEARRAMSIIGRHLIPDIQAKRLAGEPE